MVVTPTVAAVARATDERQFRFDVCSKGRSGYQDCVGTMTATETGTAGGTASTPPRRVLIVSADMGEGHNATGRALHAAIDRIWPGSAVEWLDTFDAVGGGSGSLFRWVYATSVQRLPWLYEFFYRSVWRYRWLARSSKKVIGACVGRRLAPHLDRIRPDLVLSTYPMGSTGLEWLRRNRGLDVPIGAWVSDFAPHPSWVHAGLDLNLVMHPAAVPLALASVPGAKVAVSAPPVAAGFQPGERSQARQRLGLPQEVFLAVVSCGSLGFGRADRAVRELLDGDPAAMVIVVAGRNERLCRLLRERFGGDHRVRVLGWVQDMATLMVAADVVVSNAGGVTSLEALACGRPLLMHCPIAGHGRANAELMERAGLAEVCTEPGELARVARELSGDPLRLGQLQRTAVEYACAGGVEYGLRALASITPAGMSRVLQPEDALFLHVQTPEVPQHVGVVAVFEPAPDGSAPTAADVAGWLARVPGLRGRLRPAAALRRARWIADDSVDPATLVDVRRVSPADTLSDIIDRFFSTALDAGHPTGTALLVTGLPAARTAVLVKLHHALGDGVAVLRALLAGTEGAGRSWATPPAHPLGRAGLRRGDLRRALRGLWVLARSGRAPNTPLNGPSRSPARHHELLRLPGRPLRTVAHALAVTDTELLLAVFAEAAHRVLGTHADPPTRLRLMVPWSLRGTMSLRAAGNHTGAVAVDLPVGPLELGERISAVRAAVRERTSAGVPEAANLVVRALGLLPPQPQVWAARAVYRSRWFNAIGTALPGPRWEVRLHGARLREAYPVLPLAEGVGLSWGALTWGEWVMLCLTGTEGLAGTVQRLACTITSVAQEVVRTWGEQS